MPVLDSGEEVVTPGERAKRKGCSAGCRPALEKEREPWLKLVPGANMQHFEYHEHWQRGLRSGSWVALQQQCYEDVAQDNEYARQDPEDQATRDNPALEHDAWNN